MKIKLYGTLTLDLSPAMSKIRKSLDPKWRSRLNGAKKNNLKIIEGSSDARKELTKFFDRYNTRRPHQGLADRAPDEVYWSALPRVREAEQRTT